MQIDWFTVGVQIVNFLILVLLLKKFLYRPIIEAMAQRQRNVAALKVKADQEMRSAVSLLNRYREKCRKLDMERMEILDKAKQEVERERISMMEDLRGEIDRRRQAWQSELAREQAMTMHQIKRLIGEKITGISRRALDDLAGEDLESRLLRRFLEQLEQMPENEKAKLESSIKNLRPATIATSYELSSDDRKEVEAAFHRLYPELALQFVLKPELICGIVLETEGYVWSWSLDRYLEGIEEALLSRVETPDDPGEAG
ncbi:MAG: F0F1 ATP synthase subunit delta [Gammaproteobacteria bacterium]